MSTSHILEAGEKGSRKTKRMKKLGEKKKKKIIEYANCMRDADWEYLLDSSALEHHSLNQKSMLFQPYHTAIGSTLAVRGTSNGVVLGPFSG